MEQVVEKLENINRTLERNNEITQKMLEVMQKPENPFFKVLTIAGIGVGILGIIQVIDTILKWF
jgi:preprotein translocase subunit Sss1